MPAPTAKSHVPEPPIFLGDLAERWEKSRRVIEGHVARKTLPFSKWGGKIVFFESQLREYFARLEGCTVDEAVANVRAREGGK